LWAWEEEKVPEKIAIETPAGKRGDERMES
jgi:hypothetical protein